jgi:polysaccharide biosynthesis protein PslG
LGKTKETMEYKQNHFPKTRKTKGKQWQIYFYSLLTAVVAMAGCSFYQPTQAAVSSPDYSVGFATGDTLPGLSSSQLASELSDIASLNVGWIRMDFDWSWIQPDSSTQYYWSNIDAVVAAANARHIKILATLDYAPKWAQPNSCNYSEFCAPASPAAFAAFAQAAVQRYAPEGIHSWEIWNEPNLGFWYPTPNISAYVQLLKATYPVIKAADPAATVITAGLAPAPTVSGVSYSPITFLSDMYQDGAKGFFDAVGMHPYSYPDLPSSNYTWNAWQQMAATNPSLRSIMVANGDGSKQIWMTEYGAPTGGPQAQATDSDYASIYNSDHVDENLQSEMVTQAITLQSSYSWAGPLFLYTYKDQGTSENTNENFFGVISFDGTNKPAYTALQNLLSPFGSNSQIQTPPVISPASTPATNSTLKTAAQDSVAITPTPSVAQPQSPSVSTPKSSLPNPVKVAVQTKTAHSSCSSSNNRHAISAHVRSWGHHFHRHS